MNKVIRTLVVLIILVGMILGVVLADSLISPGFAAGKPKNVEDRLKNALVFYAGSYQAKVANINQRLDEVNKAVVPCYSQGRFMVPAQFLIEKMGGTIKSQSPSAIQFSYRNKQYGLKAGRGTLVSGSSSYSLGANAVEKHNRLFVPVRGLAEALGKKVFFYHDLVVVSDYSEIFDKDIEVAALNRLIAQMTPLARIASEEQLLNLLSKFEGYANRQELYYTVSGEAKAIGENGASLAAAPSEQPQSESYMADHSTTNLQVEGVDEADIIKNDGRYLYQVSGDSICIIEAYPADKMRLVSKIHSYAEGMNPQELYVDKNTLVVIGTAYNKDRIVRDSAKPAQGYAEDMLPYCNSVFTRVVVFDITDRSKPVKTRTYEVEGRILSSRRIGDYVYTVTNKHLTYWRPEYTNTPQFRDGDGGCRSIPAKEICYFTELFEPNYLIISGINVKNANEPAEQFTCLGAGQNIYVSQNNLYVAVMNNKPVVMDFEMKPLQPSASDTAGVFFGEQTSVYRFSLNAGKITFEAKGSVPGRVLNQFSMDEHQGFFRIATTSGRSQMSGAATSSNQLYVLDAEMNITGRIENIAPGEQIYSARFLGNRAYLVTFRTVDPLYVIDVEDPKSPKILGELKIPGYSNYLHPYDENHIIGFGKDAVELESDWDPDVKWAYYQGMKVALFDVTDVANPVLKYSVNIGDRGTDSELLNNHKALLFSREKELLAFPVNLMLADPAYRDDNKLAYGEPAFQGLYVYKLNDLSGFTLKGRITHMDNPASWDYNRLITRGATIGNVLYCFSNSMVTAHDLSGMQEIGRLNIQ